MRSLPPPQVSRRKVDPKELFEAVEMQDLDALKALLAQGVTNVNVFSSDFIFKGFTPLMLAASNGDVQSVQILLAHGAEAFHKEPTAGSTALHFAVMRGCKGIPPPDNNPNSIIIVVEMLLNAGPDSVNILDKTGNTALLLAVAADPDEAKAMMAVEGQTDSRAPVRFRPFYQKKMDIIQLLMKAGTYVDHENTLGETALSIAAGRGDIAVVRLLLLHNANVNYRNTVSSATALSAALEKNRTDVAALLRNAGATE
eukprot:gnl/Hemi2/26670_TR8956_c0_g1_i1.p1 gnl/Hemi2/26670_TR8956_c0_g1~~gnl/Hemi2/26670_TR8956_c0_g1_i1.p1  ORF type:complete len:256 (-),score=48.07 gnl/Hemi2/26670_TR8956_c0_g1_i1:270-1037(-)